MESITFIDPERGQHGTRGHPLGGLPGDRRDAPYIPQVYVIGTPQPRLPAPSAAFRRFPFALCLFCHFSGSVTKPIHPSHFPPINYSFKVVFRVFRDFHSVPVKPL